MKISKRIKKLISTVLSLAMLVSVFASFSVYANEETAVVNEDAINAYGFLKAVGAMDAEEEAYDASKMITRAHFVKMALHASNDAPKVLVSNDEVFFDVDMNTKYENYIETAYRIGYISGSASGLFEPEEYITLAQASKILGNILGYEKIAEANGGYPGGYLIAAQRIDLLDGVNVNDNEPLNMENAVMLLYNAVNADLMQIVAIGDDTETKAFEDRTLLTERHKVESAEGVIDANGYTDLYAQESELEKGEILLGGEIYKAGNSNAEGYLGYNVTVYYDASETAKDKEIFYVELSDENSVITANGRDLSVSGEDIEYFTENSSKKIKLDDFVSCIVNGKMAVMDYEDLTDVTKGEINFISNDGNSAVDVINVTRYDTFLVQGVSTSSEIIIADDGTKFELEADSDEYTFEIIKNNNPATINDVASGNIILVCEGTGNGIVHKKIIVSDRVLNASFDEIGDETAVVQGAQYRVDGINISDIKTGTVYEIKLDAFNNISYVKKDNDIVYGYLYGLAKIGMDEPQCRIFTENDRWGDLYFAKKVEFNGVNMPGEDVYAALKAEEDFRQLIRYNVNSDAEIIRLQTAEDIRLGTKDADGDGIDEEALAIENDTFRLSYSGSTTYRNTPKSFNGLFFLDSAAKIFIIPSDMEKDSFKIETRSALSNDTGYSVTAYDINEYLNCKVLTMSAVTSSSVTSDDKFMLVKGVGQILDSEGTAAPSVKGWWSGIEMSFAVKTGEGGVSADDVNSLKKGDVINFKYDEDGNITYIKSYPVDEKYYVSGGLYAYTTVISGIVKKCDFENRRIKLEYKADTEAGIAYNASTPIYIWETKTETFRRASVAEFLEGDKIVANMRYLVCQEIIIVR